MKKMNVGIIGIGRIAGKYLNPVYENQRYNLFALCDLKESAEQISRKYNALFYTDYKEMLLNEEVDLVIITTPPNTHFEIAKDCLFHKKNVILEKPAVLNMEELDVLFEVAKENNVSFDVIFHWMHGNEVVYLKDKIGTFGDIKRIESTVLDPYTDENFHIKDEYIGLEGCWFDSGINCLSLLSCFIDIKKLHLVEKSYIYDDKVHQDIYSKHQYVMDDIDISITVDWRYRANHKYTNIYFTKDVLYIDHSRQIILLNNELLVDLNNGDRLENHYKNYFENYRDLNNNDNILTIHGILIGDK
ncbi:hypothetical protein DRW41_05470 [Neobacillus piezotolerans]|uniref:Gfo/Idh/MocA-like oxidoreductase N-terminal domain-containing protein n=1 Tax=Neobacillus piezotolerans TaxID=2259171 RepID=A0A3D8GSM0_9BACI|nr:Gfo/Idh/MocA family oxidoreductase [Neobacillus piezotolerans]RDU37302.1 hypothetical protein DRW41_05470 [Neobacillus piezotolerans]